MEKVFFLIKNLFLLKFGYFNNMVDKFLHKIDLDALQKEVGKTIDEIGALIEMKNPKGIYNWAKGQDNHGTRPSYNALIRLLLAGATTKTLFGVDSPVNKVDQQSPPQEFVNDPKFQESVKFVVEETSVGSAQIRASVIYIKILLIISRARIRPGFLFARKERKRSKKKEVLSKTSYF